MDTESRDGVVCGACATWFSLLAKQHGQYAIKNPYLQENG